MKQYKDMSRNVSFFNERFCRFLLDLSFSSGTVLEVGESVKKTLPCMTLCPWPAYTTRHVNTLAKMMMPCYLKEGGGGGEVHQKNFRR